jgi:hypothetical protein
MSQEVAPRAVVGHDELADHIINRFPELRQGLSFNAQPDHVGLGDPPSAFSMPDRLHPERSL